MGMSPSRRSMPAAFALMLVADDAAVGEAAPCCCRGAEAHAETHAASANDPKCFDLIVWGSWESRDYPTGTVAAQVRLRHRPFEACPRISNPCGGILLVLVYALARPVKTRRSNAYSICCLRRRRNCSRVVHGLLWPLRKSNRAFSGRSRSRRRAGECVQDQVGNGFARERQRSNRRQRATLGDEQAADFVVRLGQL